MRRQLLTHPKFQISFAYALVKGFFLSIVLPGLLFYVALESIREHPSVTPEQRAILKVTINQMVSLHLLLLTVFGIIFAGFGVFLSNRFVGPLIRIEDWATKHMRNQAAGPLRIRNSDEWSPVSQVLNRVINKFLP